VAEVSAPDIAAEAEAELARLGLPLRQPQPERLTQPLETTVKGIEAVSDHTLYGMLRRELGQIPSAPRRDRLPSRYYRFVQVDDVAVVGRWAYGPERHKWGADGAQLEQTSLSGVQWVQGLARIVRRLYVDEDDYRRSNGSCGRNAWDGQVARDPYWRGLGKALAQRKRSR